MRFPITRDWLDLSQSDATDSLADWARTCVHRLAERHGRAVDETAVAPLLEHLEAIGRHYLEVGGLGCLLLVPDATLPVRAMVRLEAFRGPETAEGFREQCQLMIPPLSWLVDPVDIRTQQSAAGPVTRVHARTAEPGVDGAPVRDTVYWSWWFPDGPQTFLASVAFADVTETGRWLDEVERLVLGGQRASGPPAVSGEMPAGEYAG